MRGVLLISIWGCIEKARLLLTKSGDVYLVVHVIVLLCTALTRCRNTAAFRVVVPCPA